MRRILGVDVGSVRVGLALSDPLGMIAQPLEVVVRKQRDPAKRIRELVEAYEIQEVVVGQPFALDGAESHATRAVAAFVTDLQTHIVCPIVFWDERLSSVEAERLMVAGGARREQRRDQLDKVAAAIILQGYLDAHVR